MNIDLGYTPQSRQAAMHASNCRMILYGGAAGGGKSHALRYDAIVTCLKNPGIQAYLFRRSLGELEDNHILPIQDELPPEIGEYREGKKRFEFRNGSRIHFCYCEKEADVRRYQGGELHWLGIDEAAHLTDFQLSYLITRNRLGSFQAVEKHLPRIVLCSNPGGPGHNWLKSKFIDPSPPETPFIDPKTKFRTVFIPAKMTDNRYLDLGYENQFEDLPPEMRDALVDGDWDAIVGKALHTLSRREHMLRSFVPPRHWTHFQVIDWGTAKPFSVGWYAVSEGVSLKDGRTDHNGDRHDAWLPEGALIRYAEYYGWDGNPNRGCRSESIVVGPEILRLEKERGDPPMDYRVGDSEMWAQHDGPSIAERMRGCDARLAMRPSKKDRKRGYAEVLARLKGVEVEGGWAPMFFATEDCRHFWRTMTTLILDPQDPEKGPDTRMEDHVFDEVSYACRSRPFVTSQDDRYLEENWEEIEQAKGGIDPYATA